MKSLFALALLSAWGLSAAQDSALTRRYQQIRYQTGDVTLEGSLAKLALGDRFKYVGQDDATFILEKLWGNPPGSKALGMIFPAANSPVDNNGWAIVIQYQEDGHVKDNDAASIQYDALLKQMRESVHAGNAERIKDGYEPMELIGWAEKPHYDDAAKKLYWAKEIRFGQNPDNTLNYNIRVLGRKGVLILNVVASMRMFPRVQEDMGQIVKLVDFSPGNRYADYKEGMDPLAKYGLAALVAGGVLAKLGFFKGFLIALLALKKFLILGALAVAAFFRRLFKKRSVEVKVPEDIAKKLE